VVLRLSDRRDACRSVARRDPGYRLVLRGATPSRIGGLSTGSLREDPSFQATLR
jgi:hypothetical protein